MVPINPSPFPTTADIGSTVIRFFTTETDPAQIAILQSLVAEYQEEYPTIAVDIVLGSPTSRGRRLLTALSSGADLGIFEIEPALMREWAEAGYLLPLDDVVNAIGRADYTPGSLFEQGDHVYALPYATSVYGLWVRTDLLAAQGLPLPTSYAEIQETARRLTTGEMYGIALPAGQNIATVNYFSTFLWQNGGDYFACDGRVTFGEPVALDALQKWAALLPYAPPGVATWGYGEQIDAFVRGRVAMAMYAGRLGVNLAEEAPELEDKTTVIFPAWGPNRVTLGVWSRLAIGAGTQHQAEAKAFLAWLLSGDRLLRYDMTVPGHMIPPLQSVQAMTLAADSPYVQRHGEWLRAFAGWVDATNHPVMNMGSVSPSGFRRVDAVPPAANAIFGTSGIISTMLQSVALGAQSPDDAWRSAVDDMESAVAAWKGQHPDWQASGCHK